MGARATAAARGRGARTHPRSHPPRPRDAPKDSRTTARAMTIQRIRVIDSHTGGEPTRVVIEGGPKLRGTLPEQLRQFRESHDVFRSAIVNEPRGCDVL